MFERRRAGLLLLECASMFFALCYHNRSSLAAAILVLTPS